MKYCNVLFWGYYIPLQGAEYIVRAAKLLESDPEIRFTMVGGGQTYDTIVALAEGLGLKKITFMSRVSIDQLANQIREADICLGIFGNTPKAQRVIPNKAYDAIATAKPLISADTPAIRELFTDRENILLCRVADPEDLAAKIRELKNDPILREHIAQGGYRLFQEQATPNIIGKQLADRLTEIIEGKNKIVVYTAIFGNKDELRELGYKPQGCDFVCFTDNPDLKSKTWQIRYEEGISDDPVRSAKFYKILPHRFFPEYDYSLWVDANIEVRGDVNQLISRYLTGVHIAFPDHSKTAMDPWDCIYDEAAFLIDRAAHGKPKDDPQLIERQVARYRAEGYPAHNGLIVGMEIVRRHNSLDVMKSMEDWWAEIQHNSRRDQLSFNYIAWKNKLHFVYMDGDCRNNKFFLWRPHKN